MSRILAVDLRHADSADRLSALVEDLAAGLGLMHAPEDLARDFDRAALPVGLSDEGFRSMPDFCPQATCRALATMIDRLLDAGLPAVFVLATDVALHLGERVQRAVSSLLAQPYVLVEDAWAWRIDRGTSGWPPHRGTSAILDRRAPELVNTWVALSDVEVDRACMHFVPLDQDPAYPAQLDRIDLAGPAYPAPAAAGSLLFWNANILHWGGACAADAAGPRFSCSFSLGRADVPDLAGSRLSPSLGPVERIDFVAEQIAIYGAGQADVSAEVLDWARATVALRRLHGRP